MLDHRKIKIHKLDTYDKIGIIATVSFHDNKPPGIGDIVEGEDVLYKITGVLLTGNSNIIYNNWEVGIYDCKLQRL